VALTGPENKPGNIAPAGVLEVRLEHEEGGPVAPLAPDNAYGRVLFVVDDPRPGRWRVIVRHARDSSFVVRAVAMRDRAVEYIREKWPSIRCTACKESLNASVALAVGILSGGAAGVFAGSTLAYLVGRTRLPEHVIKYLMERMFDTSIDRLVEGACERMQMCAA
jgi:hypothetical protein